MINVQLRLKDIYLVTSIADDVPQIVENDGQRLKQIMINLVRNSSKFTFEGYIQISLRRAKLAFVKNDRRVAIIDAFQFECYDTGIGISKDN